MRTAPEQYAASMAAAAAVAVAFLVCLAPTSSAFGPPRALQLSAGPSQYWSTSSPLRMNFFDNIGDILQGGKLEPQRSLPYGSGLCASTSCSSAGVRTFAVRERPISFTGEDFDIAEVTDAGLGGMGAKEYARVRGAMMHLPGKDKMRMVSSQTGDEVCVLDRKLVAATPTYDIYRGGNGAEKIGWIEKKLVALTDTFDVYMEGKGGFGLTGIFKPPPAYRITGDFVDRAFVMKNDKDEAVARVKMDGLVQFDEWNHYQVQVAQGMDAQLVVGEFHSIVLYS